MNLKQLKIHNYSGTYTPGERLSINLLNGRYTPPGDNSISLHLSYSGNDVQTINSNANKTLFLMATVFLLNPYIHLG